MISGNLTRDPELRATGGGTQILQFGVAVNDRARNQSTGEWEDRPNFIDCIMFGSRAESLSRFLSKGTKVAIEGKLRYSAWESKDGQRRSKLEVVVDDIEFLSSRGQQAGGQYQGAQQYQGSGQYGQGSQQYGQQSYAAPAPAPYAAPAPQQSYAAPAPQQSYTASAPAPAPVQQSYSAPAPQQYSSRPVQTPPSADVYDEDIPF